MNILPELSALNVNDLPVTQYCRVSLQRTLSAAEYYMEIYRTCLDKVLEMCSMSPDEMTVVDYGGGHGLLSIMARKLGFGKVVYVDSNADAVKMAQELSSRLGAGPDVFIHGNVESLRNWCSSNSVKPHALVSIDVIEHIYVLDEFFASLHEISQSMKMVFTTASTPYNARVVRRLHRAMQADELGTVERKGFWKMRRDHVQKLHPDMSDRELDYWADNTRGLTYEDVERAVEAQSPNLLLDEFNTCDPVTGSWTERILPIEDYRQLLAPYGFVLAVYPGRYNVYRKGPKAIASRYYNKIIDPVPLSEPSGFRERRKYRKALKVAPFIYMVVENKQVAER